MQVVILQVMQVVILQVMMIESWNSEIKQYQGFVR